MELWDILDENRHPTGRIGERGQPMNPGDFHLVVFAYIKHLDGRFLISKRSVNKTYPNTWEVTGGSAVQGDNSRSAILREVKEELGIDLRGYGQVIKTIKYVSEHSYFADIWLFEEAIDIKQVVCQKEEVSDARLVTKEEIYKLVDQGIFLPGHQGVLNCLKAL